VWACVGFYVAHRSGVHTCLTQMLGHQNLSRAFLQQNEENGNLLVLFSEESVERGSFERWTPDLL